MEKTKVSQFEYAIAEAANASENLEPKTNEEELQERIDNLKNQASNLVVQPPTK